MKEFISPNAKEFGFQCIKGGNKPPEKATSRVLKFIEPENRALYTEIYNKTKEILPPKLTIDPRTDPKLAWFTPKSYEKPYQEYAKFVHIGQRKLGMCEIQHLTSNLDNKDEHAIVIYAGAAPTNKAWIERLMFPNVKFLLVDPNMFNVYITTYRDSHYYYADKEYITYFQNSTTNFNPRYKVTDFKIRYFDGEKVDIIDNKYADDAPTTDPLADPSKWQNYIDHFYSALDPIFIMENFFTNTTSEFCNELIKGRKGKYSGCKVLFWCDLRTSTNGFASDLDILWNLAMMYNWMKMMRPDDSMLKFRCPFGQKYSDEEYAKYADDFQLATKNGNNFVDYYKNTGNIKYFPGQIYLQCWEDRHSAETRLWVSKDDIDSLEKYDRVAYEETLFYYNCIERVGLFHENPHAYADLGSDQCNDCAIEGHIWETYRLKMDKDFNIYWWMNWMGEITTRPLTRAGHGFLKK